MTKVFEIPVHDIELPEWQIRHLPDDSFINSVRKYGQVTLIVLCVNDQDEQYSLITGQRLWRAFAYLHTQEGLEEFGFIDAEILPKQTRLEDLQQIYLGSNKSTDSL